jgi:hypothetical protein
MQLNCEALSSQLGLGTGGNFTLILFLQKQNSFRSKYDDDDDDDDSADNSLQDQEPPYRSLTSPGGMRRYGTLASLELLDEKDQAADESTDSEGNGEWDSEAEEEDCSKEEPESREYRTSAHDLHSSWLNFY